MADGAFVLPPWLFLAAALVALLVTAMASASIPYDVDPRN